MIDQEKIIALFEKHWTKLPSDMKKTILNFFAVMPNPGISPFEAFLLYTFVLENKPTTLFEMGTREGAITMTLAFAQRELDRKTGYISTEINNYHLSKTKSRLDNAGLSDYVDIQLGDGIKIAPQGVDMCVIDANHNYEFATMYINGLYPKCSDGCLCFAHDHIPYTSTQYNNDGQINLPLDIKATPLNHEQRAVKEFLLRTGTPYSFLQAITGGVKTPLNEELLSIIDKITGQNIFGHPNHKMGNRLNIPQSILYRLTGEIK